ncbi:hypothetical protein, partial [Streptomyces viridochromogenes]|uniref:hypothetical protein n=1 Tax=Streptomyces viridochromogenes TaxID=1938 RepID=UPI001AD83F6C
MAAWTAMVDCRRAIAASLVAPSASSRVRLAAWRDWLAWMAASPASREASWAAMPARASCAVASAALALARCVAACVAAASDSALLAARVRRERGGFGLV